MMLFNKDAKIEITPADSDERSEKNKKFGKLFDVSYILGDIEIEGKLKPYYTGRTTDYDFEPSYFSDSESEAYWDENWEDIEKQIINEL